jgi:hypothetical protein
MRAPTSLTVADEARAWIGRADRGEIRTRSGKPYKPAVLRLYRRDVETGDPRARPVAAVAASLP